MPFIRVKGGGLQENGFKDIPLPFTKENVLQLLDQINREASLYSHQDFANWAYKTVVYHIDSFDRGEQVSRELEALALDIDTQWDLMLFNTYQTDELIKLDLSKVKFPEGLLQGWKQNLTGNNKKP